MKRGKEREAGAWKASREMIAVNPWSSCEKFCDRKLI
jgi:hypothetical protein